MAAACRRAPVETAPETPDLPPPESSAGLVVTPLDNATTGFTNEMQAKILSEETTELGIQHISKHMGEGDPGRAEAGPPPPMSEIEKKERMQQLKEMSQQFSRMRRGIDSERDKSVVLPGSTAAIIKGRTSGGVLGADEDSPGVWSGAYGGAVETGERVAADQAAWSELWGRVSREPAPAVDFAKNRIAAVFVGPRPTPGYKAKLIGIAAEPNRYLLRYYEEGPAPGEAVGDGPTAPFLLVTVPADDKAIRWEKKRRTEGPKIK